MISRNKEISIAQKKQKSIKREIRKAKKKLPVYFITFVLVTVLSIYFLEDPLYDYFGSSYNFMLTTIFILTFVFLAFTYRIFLKISKKQKESKAIGTKLYKLMKLEDETN